MSNWSEFSIYTRLAGRARLLAGVARRRAGLAVKIISSKFKISSGYELGWYVISSSEKTFGLYRIVSREQQSSYPGEILNLLFIFESNGIVLPLLAR